MRTDGLTVFEYMEDFDNAELDQFERGVQLRSAVLQYNCEYGTEHDPEKTFRNYIRIQIKRQQDEL